MTRTAWSLSPAVSRLLRQRSPPPELACGSGFNCRRAPAVRFNRKRGDAATSPPPPAGEAMRSMSLFAALVALSPGLAGAASGDVMQGGTSSPRGDGMETSSRSGISPTGPMVVIAYASDLRQAPKSDARADYRLAQGSEVVAFRTEGEWVRVNFGDATGWMLRSHLKSSEASPKPAVTARSQPRLDAPSTASSDQAQPRPFTASQVSKAAAERDVAVEPARSSPAEDHRPLARSAPAESLMICRIGPLVVPRTLSQCLSGGGKIDADPDQPTAATPASM